MTLTIQVTNCVLAGVLRHVPAAKGAPGLFFQKKMPAARSLLWLFSDLHPVPTGFPDFDRRGTVMTHCGVILMPRHVPAYTGPSALVSTHRGLTSAYSSSILIPLSLFDCYPAALPERPMGFGYVRKTSHFLSSLRRHAQGCPCSRGPHRAVSWMSATDCDSECSSRCFPRILRHSATVAEARGITSLAITVFS